MGSVSGLPLFQAWLGEMLQVWVSIVLSLALNQQMHPQLFARYTFEGYITINPSLLFILWCLVFIHYCHGVRLRDAAEVLW